MSHSVSWLAGIVGECPEGDLYEDLPLISSTKEEIDLRDQGRMMENPNTSDVSIFPVGYDRQGSRFVTQATRVGNLSQPVIMAALSSASSTPGQGVVGLGTPVDDSPGSLYPLPGAGQNDSMDLD